MNTFIIAIIIVIIGSILGALGSLFLKKGSKKLSFSFISFISNRDIIKGVILFSIATVIFIPALKMGPLSVLFPMTALTHVWVLFFSKKFLKENMNNFKWIGVMLIILGVALIGLGSG